MPAIAFGQRQRLDPDIHRSAKYKQTRSGVTWTASRDLIRVSRQSFTVLKSHANSTKLY